uniref:Globin domain-containing protein n=1 Tax=Physcomitrium patens TaxID=3218 RepID=A0A7I4CA54_PHYPA
MASAVVNQSEAAAVRAPSKPVKTYSKENEQLVKQSWEILKKDAQRNGINFFRKVFEIAPGAKAMYSFLRDSTIPFEENPKVKNHARYVFMMTGDAAVQLGEKGAYQVLESKLQKLAATHVNAGVTDDQFEVFDNILINLWHIISFRIHLSCLLLDAIFGVCFEMYYCANSHRLCT